MMRSFIAIPVPREAKDYIATAQQFLKKHGVKAKWTRPESSHLTLLFLGDQKQADLDRFCDALAPRMASIDPFDLELDQLDTFGRTPRVLFLGWRESRPEAFAELSETVSNTAVDIELPLREPPGRKKPVPHLTLARFKTRGDAKSLYKIGDRDRDSHQWDWEIRLPAPPKPARSFAVDRVTLYQSTLTPHGAIYDVIRELPLGG